MLPNERDALALRASTEFWLKKVPGEAGSPGVHYLPLVLMQGSSRECLGSADETVDFIYGDGTMQLVEAGRPGPSSSLSRVCCRLSFNLPEYTRLSSVTEEAAYRCVCWKTLPRIRGFCWKAAHLIKHA